MSDTALCVQHVVMIFFCFNSVFLECELVFDIFAGCSNYDSANLHIVALRV